MTELEQELTRIHDAYAYEADNYSIGRAPAHLHALRLLRRVDEVCNTEKAEP